MKTDLESLEHTHCVHLKWEYLHIKYFCVNSKIQPGAFMLSYKRFVVAAIWNTNSDFYLAQKENMQELDLRCSICGLLILS